MSMGINCLQINQTNFLIIPRVSLVYFMWRSELLMSDHPNYVRIINIDSINITNLETTCKQELYLNNVSLFQCVNV